MGLGNCKVQLDLLDFKHWGQIVEVLCIVLGVLPDSVDIELISFLVVLAAVTKSAQILCQYHLFVKTTHAHFQFY